MNQTLIIRTPGEVKSAVIAQLASSSAAFQAIIKPPFKVEEVLALVTEIVQLIETLAPANLTGEQKQAIAEAVYDWVDAQYRLGDTLYDRVSRYLGWLKWLPFGLKGKIVTAVVSIAIRAIVAGLNATIWKNREGAPDAVDR